MADRGLSDIFAAIAAVYRSEGREASFALAEELSGFDRLDGWPLPEPCALDQAIRTCLSTSDQTVASAVLAGQSMIPWGVNPVENQMTRSAAAMVAVSTLLGPEGPIISKHARMGLLYMCPNSYYPLHNHDADETYVLVAGAALWTAGEDRRWRDAGDMIHHPSLMPHAFRTGDQGFVALWRWSGDINTHSYAFLPDAEADQV